VTPTVKLYLTKHSGIVRQYLKKRGITPQGAYAVELDLEHKEYIVLRRLVSTGSIFSRIPPE